MKSKSFYHLMIMILLCMTFLFLYDSKILCEHSLYASWEMSAIMDDLSVSFIMTVSMISLLVLMYAVEYMHNDKYINKFIVTMMAFILSMYVLATSSNMAWAMAGWDGLGLSSYCLIIFYRNMKGKNSGCTTLMYNRMGDIFLIISISFLFMTIGSWSAWPTFLALAKEMSMWIKVMLCILIMVASFSKSAQIPFSAWLPEAMAAPTPVSALVHSSTLVTAGIFLTIRFYPVMSSEFQSLAMKLISCLTVMMAAMGAIFEWDLKKIIAFSTLSHIGFMFMFLSIELFHCAMFHLTMHAVFKSLLFMCAGMIIHNSLNCQDIRSIGLSLNEIRPWTVFLISIFSMMGIPFLSGFYSKDLMILSFLNWTKSSSFACIMYGAIMLTCAYSMRMVFYLRKSISMLLSLSKLCEVNISLKYGGALSISLGSILVSYFFPDFLFDYTYFSMAIKLGLIMIMIMGSILGLIMYKFKSMANLFKEMWYSSVLFCFVKNPSFYLSYIMMYFLDSKGLIDYSLEKTLKMIKWHIMINNTFMYSFHNKFVKTFKVFLVFYLVSILT